LEKRRRSLEGPAKSKVNPAEMSVSSKIITGISKILETPSEADLQKQLVGGFRNKTRASTAHNMAYQMSSHGHKVNYTRNEWRTRNYTRSEWRTRNYTRNEWRTRNYTRNEWRRSVQANKKMVKQTSIELRSQTSQEALK
jgi:hypothetical protein